MSAPPSDIPEFDPKTFEPIIIGPTWKRDEEGKFILPKLSLGYEGLRWTFEWLQAPGGGPWRFTAEQARFFLWYYALKPDGSFLYRDAVLQRSKGWGKDPLTTVISAWELCGPCRFDHWDKDGNAVGRQPAEPWIQIAATNKNQTDNGFKFFPVIFGEKAKRAFDLKIGAETIRAQGGIGKAEMVTSSPEALEGKRPSLFVAGETHLWYASNKGHRMAEVGRRNARKVRGRVLAHTNAFQPGLNSQAEIDRRFYEDIAAGRRPDNGFLYDSIEAPANAPLTPEAAKYVMERVRGDAVWLDIDEIVAGITDGREAPSTARRFYYNQIVAAEDALIVPQEWDQCFVDDDLRDGDEVVLGLDPSKTDDATALVAIRISDRFIKPLKIWEIPQGPAGDGVEIDMTQVSDEVAVAFARFKVRAFFSDVNPVQGYVDQWSDQYREQLLIKATPGKSAVGFDMRGNGREIMLMNEALVGSFREQTVRHNEAPGSILRQHALNAYQQPRAFGEDFGMSFRKESRESSRKVDGWAATVLAYTALNRYLESNKRPAEEQDGSFYIFY